MTALARVPARSIIRAIADAAERWCDADLPPRVRATDRIVERTGYSVPVVEYALDRLFMPLTMQALEETIVRELGSVAVLDRFSHGALAAPVGAACIISSRTTIGVALWPALYALCAKCDVLVKDREDHLIASFFETLAQEGSEFKDAARAQAWEASDEGAPQVAQFDAVVTFGADETLATVAAACKPGARFVGFGSRASAGYVTRESLADVAGRRAIARGAARDLLLYETEGCLSLHVLFVEGAREDENVTKFLDELSAAIDAAAIEFPGARYDAARGAAAGEYHRLSAFRAAGGEGAVYGAPGKHAVVVKHSHRDAPAFLPRTLDVHFVDGTAQALQYIELHRLPLEAFAVSDAREDLLATVIGAGAARITAFGELQHPLPSRRHGGRQRIADFIRWIENEL